MKKYIMLLLVICAAQMAIAQYKPVEQASSLKFTIKNLGFGVNGSFSGFNGIVNFDPKDAAESSFNVSVDATTVNTGNSLRDEHLKADGYFDVKKYPVIRLVSEKISAAKNGVYQFNGVLTLKGKLKTISFPFTVADSAGGYLFKGSFKINRRDFGVGGSSTIADELEVVLNVLVKNG